MDQQSDVKIKTLVETENYSIWRADELDDESTYHVEVNNVTIHFFKEEWEEFIELIKRLQEVDY
jgi:hypothetical protein